ncbi:MAG: hypothetical protein JEY94_13555 [Melioribacteraceae bacterium]|nr:hypothetical protein [Melioribacteraceae bacterium]
MKSENSEILGYEEHAPVVDKLSFSKFKNLGKEKFPNYIRFNFRPQDLLNQVAAISSYRLPPQYAAYYLTMETYPFYWISASTVLLKAESLFTDSAGIRSAASSFSEMKKFFGKWIVQQVPKEKKYFAVSTLNIIEKNSNNHNFLKHIFKSIILTYEESQFNPTEAERCLDIAVEVIKHARLDRETRKELYYLIELHRGFLKIKTGQDYESGKYFANALENKPNGIVALYNEAIEESKNGNTHKAIENLNKIIQFDAQCFQYAIDNGSKRLFDYFLKNAMLYYIFTFEEFSNLDAELENIFQNLIASNKAILINLHDKLDSMRRIEFDEYLTPEVEAQIEFFKEFIEEYQENRNTLILLAGKILVTKFNSVIQGIIDLIERSYLEQINSRLNVYEVQLKDLRANMDGFRTKADFEKETSKTKLDLELSDAEDRFDTNIKILERKLEGLEVSDKFNPGIAFNNAMANNIMISLIIFVIGGFGGAFLDSEGSGNIISQILISGIKWGGVTFLIGTIAAVFSSGSSLNERYREKNRLIKKIEILKGYKEDELKKMKKRMGETERGIDEIYRGELIRNEDEIKRLTGERDHKFSELKEMAESKVHAILEKLRGLLIG